MQSVVYTPGHGAVAGKTIKTANSSGSSDKDDESASSAEVIKRAIDDARQENRRRELFTISDRDEEDENSYDSSCEDNESVSSNEIIKIIKRPVKDAYKINRARCPCKKDWIQLIGFNLKRRERK